MQIVNLRFMCLIKFLRKHDIWYQINVGRLAFKQCVLFTFEQTCFSIRSLSLPWLSPLTLSAAPLCLQWYCNATTAASHLCMCVCVFEFHVLVKFSFWQQIEQHQVTYNRSLEIKQRTAFVLLFCRRRILVDVLSHTTPKIPTPEPMAVSVGIISNFLACEAQITLH